mgnify:CR=1 FL=1
MLKNLITVGFFSAMTADCSSFLVTTETALTHFSMFLRISFATTKGPMLLCLAKKIMTLSLAIYVLMFPELVFETITPMNEPSMRWTSRVDI